MIARQFSVLTAGLLLMAACGGKGGGGNGNNNNCPEGFRPEGRACVPIFDDCPGPAEIPVLGGGCQPVGVTECATGFVTDGEGGCDPILPSDPCPAGTMEVIGESECQPVGVTQCAQGFVSDGEGGCDAILPPGPDPCPFGTMEVLGHTECQPIGDCGTGTWGNITTDATTVFVDQSADATGADGSDASPFTAIADAMAVVQPGGQIAVAAGDYTERLAFNQQVHLAGRCAELVTIRGRFYLGENRPPVLINGGGSGSTVRGVTLTGDAEGLEVNGATGVSVEEVQVVDTGNDGISLGDQAEVVLRRVVVAGCTRMGIFSEESSLEVFESVVRDTSPLPDGTWGRGINAQCDPNLISCGSLTVTGSLVSGNREIGIYAAGVDAAVTSTVVRDTLPQQSDGRFGRGINVQCYPELGVCGSLTVTASLVAGNEDAGIFIAGVHAVLSGVAVKDTVPNEAGPWAGDHGQGIFAKCFYPIQGRYCPLLQMSHCIVDSSYSAGVAIQGGVGSMFGSVIRNVNPRPFDDAYGYGLQVEGLDGPGAGQTFFDVQSCQILDATLAGVLYVRAQGTVSGCEVGGADFSIVMNQGAAVTVTDDNLLSGQYEDEPSWQNMEPSPAPAPTLPVEQ